MIRKPADATSLRRINELHRPKKEIELAEYLIKRVTGERGEGKTQRVQRLGAQHVWRTYLVLLQHHKIEMSDALLRVLPHSLSKGRLADNVTNVLVNKRISVTNP